MGQRKFIYTCFITMHAITWSYLFFSIISFMIIVFITIEFIYLFCLSWWFLYWFNYIFSWSSSSFALNLISKSVKISFLVRSSSFVRVFRQLDKRHLYEFSQLLLISSKFRPSLKGTSSFSFELVPFYFALKPLINQHVLKKLYQRRKYRPSNKL